MLILGKMVNFPFIGEFHVLYLQLFYKSKIITELKVYLLKKSINYMCLKVRQTRLVMLGAALLVLDITDHIQIHS